MKGVFLVIIAVIFSSSMYSQEVSLSNAADQVAEAEVVVEQTQDVETQIKDALMKDENLQKEAINYLKENPETASSVADILQANEGSMDGIISAVLGDSELAKTAVNYIKNNPEMLKQVMKLAGM